MVDVCRCCVCVLEQEWWGQAATDKYDAMHGVMFTVHVHAATLQFGPGKVVDT
jgi:hypothetical protein